MRSGILMLLAILPLACATGGPAIPLPPLNADEAGRQALADYDANRDGILDGGELEQCPPLKHSLPAFDKDGDGKLSATEIADRLRTYLEGDAGLLGLVCQVTLDGRPLSGATVTLVPEKFLGPHIQRASGLTNEQGYVRLQTAGLDVPGVHYGLFRVEVSQPSAGVERLPAKFNSQTTLGLEINGETVTSGAGSVIALTSP